MKIFKNKYKLQKEILSHKSISFIPTMGGLHKGHKFIINKARKKTGKTLVSIFVNPKQFNNKKDFIIYPRNLNKDLRILRRLKVDYVYLPNKKDIFAFKPNKRIFLDKFAKQLCGKYRVGHFEGVLDVVNRFLEIIEPKNIFLGKKDYQQLILIKKHIIKRRIKTKVISCKTIREKNGIPCSTRNKNLSKKQIKIAASLFNFISKIKDLSPKKSNLIKKYLSSIGVKKIDYIEFLNLKTLKRPLKKKKSTNIFIAYHLGKIRLIDNI